MRRRVDLSRLSASARYAVALTVLAAVVGIVLLVRGNGGGHDQPSTWYTVLVKAGAVALLLYLAGRLVRWVRNGVRRRPPGGR